MLCRSVDKVNAAIEAAGGVKLINFGYWSSSQFISAINSARYAVWDINFWNNGSSITQNGLDTNSGCSKTGKLNVCVIREFE